MIARLRAVPDPLPASKPELKALAGELVTAERPGDWAQAMMDLGATICRPKAPLCERCPIAFACAARAQGDPDTYPRKSAKAERPRRHGAAFVLIHRGQVALERRPPRGLLGGMLALPTTDWRAAPLSTAEITESAPAAADWRPLGSIEHVFTHFTLTLQVWRGEAASADPDLEWLPIDEAGQALPSVFLKALRAGVESLP